MRGRKRVGGEREHLNSEKWDIVHLNKLTQNTELAIDLTHWGWAKRDRRIR